MTGTVKVYMPYAESGAAGAALTPRIPTLVGKTVGLVNNGWRSLDITYREFRSLLTDKYEVAEIIEKRKPSPSRALQDDAFKDLVDRADAVIVGLGT